MLTENVSFNFSSMPLHTWKLIFIGWYSKYVHEKNQMQTSFVYAFINEEGIEFLAVENETWQHLDGFCHMLDVVSAFRELKKYLHMVTSAWKVFRLTYFMYDPWSLSTFV